METAGATNHSGDTLALLAQAQAGDRDALDTLFARHRDRLLQMLRFRMGGLLSRRVDASDVLQEAHVEAWRRLPSYLAEDDPMPFFLWLRFLTGQKVAQMHRHHVGAQRRDVRREIRMHELPGPDNTSIADVLAGQGTSPPSGAARAERHARLLAVLDEMNETDRDVLCLRHFEQLTGNETARELGITTEAAGKRYIRALRRLKDALGNAS